MGREHLASRSLVEGPELSCDVAAAAVVAASRKWLAVMLFGSANTRQYVIISTVWPRTLSCQLMFLTPLHVSG